MNISTTEAALRIAGPEEPIASLTINGDTIYFTAYDGTLESTTAGTPYTLSLSGFSDYDEAFYNNTAPTANAGVDQANITAGTTVTLDGSVSSDSDGTIVSYAWTQKAGETVTLSNNSAVSPTFTAPTTGSAQTLTFQLTVTDDGGLTSTPDSVDIQVDAQNTGNGANPASKSTYAPLSSTTITFN